MKKLLVFDASNYMFRAFYAAPPMNNSAGFPTNALHFYTTMILSVIHRVHPDVIALACERRGPKFRHLLYPDYKGQREAPPEELQKQFPYFRPITDALGITAYEADSFEADDVIATLTRQAKEQGMEVVIASSDKDLMQLIEKDDSVIMLDAMSKSKSKDGHFITYADVQARFNVDPSQVADVLALAGDTIDNIPGCKGIGEKTAGKLIAEYGSLENLMNRRSEIRKPSQKANLEAFAPNAELSKKLTTLVFDVPVTLQMTSIKPDPDKVIPLFSALELHKLLSEVLPGCTPDRSVPRIGQEPPSEESGDISSEEIPRELPQAINTQPSTPAALIRPFLATSVMENEQDFKEFCAHLQNQPIAVCPLWLSEKLDDRILMGCALATPQKSVYLPLHKERSLFESPVGARNLESAFEHLLTDSSLPKIVYGLKPLCQYALKKQFSLNADNFFDVEIAAYLIHPERKTLSLVSCAQEYLGHTLDSSPDDWNNLRSKVPDHAGIWAQCIFQLGEKLPFELDANQLRKPFDELDLPLAPILAAMEFYGVGLDTQNMSVLSESFDAEIQRLSAEIFELAGCSFNLNSPREVGNILFDKLGLVPGTKKNRQHGLSTDQDTLESIDHPIAELILKYRLITKLRSTYVESLLHQVDPRTHRIHGRFNACVTATTRLSSSDPNLQNIPSREEIGRRIKRAFVPQSGWSFVSADYSQIELRMMASFSKDPVLCTAYQNGEDVHARTAASLFEVPIEEVTKSQRQLAKTINFGLLYGMGVQKLARETGYSKDEAKNFLKKFHEQFPVLSEFFESQVETARQNGETRTLFGHRRPIRELFSQRPMDRAFGERIALNAPIQGSASDIVKCAMIRLDNQLKSHHLQARLLIQVHDELLIECPDEEIDQVSDILIDAMENAADIGIPLKVELKIGKNWADMF